MNIKIAMLGIMGIFATTSLVATVINIKTEKEYTEALKQPYVVIKFFAPWCGVCTSIKDTFEAISTMPEFSHIIFGEINISEANSLTKNHAIIGIPTIVFIHNGKEIKRSIGMKNEATFKEDLIKTIRSVYKI